MNNPFRILRFLWKARRPSHISDMPAVRDAFWLKKGYDAVTFFGFILTHTEQEARLMNGRLNALKNHEMIHLRQAQACGDSWCRFYWRYLVFWLKAQKGRKLVKNAGYRLNPFEMEAYAHMDDLSYLSRFADGATGWQHYARLSLQERAALLAARGKAQKE